MQTTTSSQTPATADANPLRDGLTNRPQPKACSLVIFGATGDLTHRKLVPALYNLAADGDLPPGIAIIGFARRDKSDEVFRKEMEEATRKFSRQPVKDELWNAFAQSLFYHRSEFDNDEGYRTLAERLDKLDAERATGGRRMFYLAAGPEQFEPIISRLAKSGLNKPGAHADGAGEGWSRVIVEKPFGTDLPSAHNLNEVVASAFHESNTYRIDHFLGKETAQNIMVLRFANSIFEPIWNARYIDHIEITAAETLGVEGRAGYYETSGALRDMVQNHLIQLLTLVCMEPPTDLRADSVRDEKVKVLRSLRPMKTGDDVKANVIRGQYSAGSINGKEAPAYRNEQNVKPGSMTETFVAMRVRLDNWRWSGVPIYIRVGKRLPKSGAEISVHLKNAPGVLFNQRDDGAAPPAAATDPGAGANVLVIRIQPEEGVSLRMQSKLPGAALRIEPVKMDFQYGESFGKASPEAYERLLLDAMSGDPTLFARRDEVEEAWGFVDSIEQAWHDSTEGSATSKEGGADAPQLFEYAAGSWGPKEADDLLAKDGRTWRRF